MTPLQFAIATLVVMLVAVFTIRGTDLYDPNAPENSPEAYNERFHVDAIPTSRGFATLKAADNLRKLHILGYWSCLPNYQHREAVTTCELNEN